MSTVSFKHIGIALAALAAAAPAQAEWREATTKHFVIYSEDSEKTLRDFATRLERFDAAIRHMRSLPDPDVSPSNRLTIFVVPSSAVSKLYGKGGANVGGFYMGRMEGSYAITPRIGSGGDSEDHEQLVLLHEYGHHFMFQTYPGAHPAWLVEGFAEFHSTARFDRNGSVGLGLPANHRAYGLLTMKPIKIDTLLTAAVGDLKPEDMDVFYGRGWLLTHYLTLDPARKGQLAAYLRLLNAGKPSLAAAKEAFGDLATLDKDLNRYLRQSSLIYHKLPPERISIGPVAIRTLPPGADAVMDVRIRSKRGVNEEQAKALLPLARKAAAPFPADVMAQVTLAEAAYDAGEYAEAEAAADRALAADPKSGEAMIYKGRAKMALAEASDAADAAVWREVRKWFVAANKNEPQDPEPLVLFYRSFLAAGAKPTANAALGLEEAMYLAPQDDGLRWMVGRQHLIDGKAEDARHALAPLAFDPHGGALAKAAAAVLEQLGSGGAEAALKAMHRAPEEEPAAEGAAGK